MKENSVKAHIASIHDARAQNDANSVSLANALSKDIATGFAGGMNYIYEFLQNADDSSDASVTVSFTLSGNNLMISHSGKHFSPDDVERICGYAEQVHTDKSRDIEKTGYKGIGFKSVFSISDCVVIASNAYQFRFDKDYPRWKEGFNSKKPYPWQIIPILTEDAFLEESQKLALHDGQVHFFIKLNHVDIVKQVSNDLSELLKHPEMVLFLRNTRKINCDIDGVKQEILIQVDEYSRVLYLNEALFSEWWLSTKNININETEHKKLQELNDFQCPPKLKHAKSVKVTIAYQVKDKHLNGSQNHPLYTYLPTQSDFGFPFIVNSDFILNPERTSLVNCDWNRFLVTQIPAFHLESLSELASTNFRSSLLFVIAKVTIADSIRGKYFQETYSLAFKRALQTITFLPSLGGEKLLKVPECYIDALGLWKVFPALEDPAVNLHQVLDHELLESQRLYNLPGFAQTKQVLSWANLLKNLNLYAMSISLTCEANAKFIAFIAGSKPKATYYSNPEQDLLLLRQSRYILSDKGQLEKAEALYFQADTDLDDIFQDFDIIFTNKVVVQHKQNKQFLANLGISTFSHIQFLERTIINELNEEKNPERLIQLLQFVFDLNQQSELQKSHFQALRHANIVTTNKTIAKANGLYLSDVYRETPTQLDKYFVDTSVFVANEYLRESDSRSAWHAFFTKMAVMLLDSIVVRKDYSYEQAKNDLGSQFLDYYRTLPVRTSSRPKSSDYFKLFPFIPILHLKTKHSKVLDVFWHMLAQNAEALMQYESTRYHYGNTAQSVEVMTYLIFQLQHTRCLPATSGNLHKSVDLYSPEFTEYARFGLLVAFVPINLPEPLVKFIGFKTRLSVNDSILILRKMDSNESLEFIIETHMMVLRTLLDTGVENKADGIKLLSRDNKLKLTKDLQYTSSEHPVSIPENWLKSYDHFSVFEMEKICDFFKIKIIEKPDSMIEFTDMTKDPAPIQHVKMLLPYLALLESKENGRLPKDNQQALFMRLMQLDSCDVSNLQVKQENKVKKLTHYLADNTLYFSGRWNRQALKYELLRIIGQFLGLSQRSLRALQIVSELKDVIDKREWLVNNDLDIDSYTALHQYLLNLIDAIKQGVPIAQIDANDPHVDSELLNSFAGLVMDDVSGSEERVSPLTLSSEEDAQVSEANPANPEKTKIKRKVISHFIPEHRADVDIDLTHLRVTPEHGTTMQDITEIPEPTEEMMRKKGGFKAKHSKALLSDEDKVAIGRWGEVRVYHYLKAYYRKKMRYQHWNFKETRDGFTLVDPDKGSFLKVIWPNYESEKGLPYDFKVIRHNINGKTDERLIEVKSTPSTKAANMFFSGNEWLMMLKYQNRYRWFRVRGAGSDKTFEILKIKNPADKIKNGNLTPNEAIFRV